MATYVLLNLTASGSKVTQRVFQEAINGCRPQADYKYRIIFATEQDAIVALNNAYPRDQFENCVKANLARSGGELEPMVVVQAGDLGQFSRTVQTQILQLVQQIQNDGNTVEGF
ncbi:MAG: hypothetical protein JOZ51_15045 [Chloroflexi bacterium]|nr:hypothetical protein [Chloroflexota bacterium]